MNTKLATLSLSASLLALSALSVLALSALAACRNPAVPPEPPPTETKPAAGAEQPALR